MATDPPTPTDLRPTATDPANTTDHDDDADPGKWRATAQALQSELDFTRGQLEHAQAILGATTGVLVGLPDGGVRLYRDGRDFYRDRFGSCHITDGKHVVAVYAEHNWCFAEFTPVADHPAAGGPER